MLPDNFSISNVVIHENQSWGLSIKSQRELYVFDLAVNEDGSIFIVGETKGVAPGIDADLSFALSISSDGSIDWYEEWGRDTEEYGWGDSAKSVDVDVNGNSYIAGRVSQGVVLDNESVLGSSDGYLLKFDPKGEMQWAKYLRICEEETSSGIRIPCSGWDVAEEVFVANDSNVLVGSTFTTLSHEDLYGYVQSLRNYDQSGNLLWERILHNDAGLSAELSILPGVDQDSVTVISSYYDGVDKGIDSSNLPYYTNTIHSISLENGDILQSWDFPDLRLGEVAILSSNEILALENYSRYYDPQVGICDGLYGQGCWLNNAYLIDSANNQDLIFTYGPKIANPVAIDDIFWGVTTVSSGGWPPTLTRSITARDFEGRLLNEIMFDNHNPQETLIEVQKSEGNSHRVVSVSNFGSQYSDNMEIIISSTSVSVDNVNEGPLDLDDNGFVDEVTNYQMWTASGGVDLTNRRGRTYSDSTSRKWDAIKAVEADNEFSVLVEGHLSKEGKYKVVTADDEGVIVGATRWLNGNRMLDSGYEEVFSMDFNGNGVVDLV